MHRNITQGGGMRCTVLQHYAYNQGQRNVKTLINRAINMIGGRANGAQVIKMQRTSFPIRNFERSNIGLISNAFFHGQMDSLLVLKTS
jgi:hypothetical protein